MTRPEFVGDLAAKDRRIVTAFFDHDQGQVFRFWPRLTPSERQELIENASAVDLELVSRLVSEVLGASSARPEVEPFPAVETDDPDRDRARAAGRELLASGRVAFYTVAGGQGTRLGFDGPKGSYPVGPFSGKTLFAWHAEKIRAASERYGVRIPWILLVSATNREATRQEFDANDWYGLDERVFLVEQRMNPTVDSQGRILLASPSRILLSPNGHGGAVSALFDEGTLPKLAGEGIEVISYFQVDNPLVNPADAEFLGYHRIKDSEMSAKVVPKRDAAEKAGVVARVNGRPGVVEYTEIPEELATAVDAQGRLVYRLANIAAHVFSVDFLSRLEGEGLPYHTAVKKVTTLDDEGRPAEVEGRKFETFIFDAIPLARGFTAFLSEREEEFSPLKNAEGEDSPATVRRDLLARTRRWYERAGRAIPRREEELEVSPIKGYDYESFVAKLRREGR